MGGPFRVPTWRPSPHVAAGAPNGTYALAMPVLAYQPMTLVDLAGHLGRADDDERRWRLVLEFLEEYSHEGDGRVTLLADEPPSTGDARWDLLLGALAEHLATTDDRQVPPWSLLGGRVWIGRIWFLDPLPSARVWALAHSPAAFRRRGVFLHPDDLHRA